MVKASLPRRANPNPHDMRRLPPAHNTTSKCRSNPRAAGILAISPTRVDVADIEVGAYAASSESPQAFANAASEAPVTAFCEPGAPPDAAARGPDPRRHDLVRWQATGLVDRLLFAVLFR